MDIKEVADVVAQNLLQAGYHPVMDPTAGDADKHTFLWFQQCSGNKQEYVCVAAMQRIHIVDLNHLMKASEVLLNNIDGRMSYFQCLLLFISSASEKGADSIVNRCCSYYATSGEYTMLISGHLNAKTGLLSVSPPSVVGHMQWKKATRLLTNFIRPHEYL